MFVNRSKASARGSRDASLGTSSVSNSIGATFHPSPSSSASRVRSKVPSLIELIEQRDFTGAICLLEYECNLLSNETSESASESASTSGLVNVSNRTVSSTLWLAYAHFHLGEFDAALALYRQLVNNDTLPRRRNSSNAPFNGERENKLLQQQQSSVNGESVSNNGKVSLTARLMGSKGKNTSSNGSASDVQCNTDTGQNASTAASTAAAAAAAATSGTNVTASSGLLLANISQDDVYLYISLCYFFLGQFEQSTQSLMQVGFNCSLKNRLTLHLNVQCGEEDSININKSSLSADDVDDQLCRASIYYLHNQLQEAIDVYKSILAAHPSLIAIDYYLALCYFKLDYYDVSQDLLSAYLRVHPKSIMGINLKACNHYKLYNGKTAEAELHALTQGLGVGCPFSRQLIRHNLVVFRNGEAALQVLPDLVSVLPEARVNLIIHHLRDKQYDQAFYLTSDLQSADHHLTTVETIVLAVVYAILGQRDVNREQLSQAQSLFEKVGSSPAECDTIPGRQAMASCYFLMRQFEDVVLYLSSIKSYFYNDENFNFIYGQAKASTGKFIEAEEALSSISDPEIRGDPVYLAWLTRTFIMNNKADRAWSIYYSVSAPAEASQAARNDSGQVLHSDTSNTNSQGFALLTLIANDCYNRQLYLDSCKAFDLLDRMEVNPEYWEGKRGAAAGHFQKVVQGKESTDSLHELLRILSRSVTSRPINTASGQRIHKNPQAEQMTSVMKKWLSENAKE